jgi:hypothetical protein
VFFIGVFLLIAIGAILMLASVMTRDPSEADGGDATAPREAFARQLVLLKHGDWKALQATFTPAAQTGVTKAAVAVARPAYADRSVDDLVGSIEVVETEGGAQEAVVKDAEGHAVTRLVRTDGLWLADRVWFQAP